MFFSESHNYFGSTLNVEASETGLTGDQAGVYRLIAESTEEWYNLREKMMKLEHYAIIKEDQDLLSEGASSFFTQIGDWFMKALARIKEIWQKFVTWITQQVATDNQFVKKYEGVLRNKTLNGFKVQGHKWKKGSLGDGLKFEVLLRRAEEFMDHVENVKDTASVAKVKELMAEGFADAARAAVLGRSGEVKEGEFASEIRKTFMEGGELEAVELQLNDLPSGVLLDIIKNANKNIDSAKKEQKVIEKLLSEAAKFYKELGSRMTAPNSDKAATRSGAYQGPADYKKAGMKGYEHDIDDAKMDAKDSDHSVNIKGRTLKYDEGPDGKSDKRVAMREAAGVAASGCRTMATIASSAFGVLISGIKDRRNEFRSIIAKMVTFNGGKDDAKKSESYDFGAEGGSILDMFA